VYLGDMLGVPREGAWGWGRRGGVGRLTPGLQDPGWWRGLGFECEEGLCRGRSLRGRCVSAAPSRKPSSAPRRTVTAALCWESVAVPC